MFFNGIFHPRVGVRGTSPWRVRRWPPKSRRNASLHGWDAYSVLAIRGVSTSSSGVPIGGSGKHPCFHRFIIECCVVNHPFVGFFFVFLFWDVQFKEMMLEKQFSESRHPPIDHFYMLFGGYYLSSNHMADLWLCFTQICSLSTGRSAMFKPWEYITLYHFISLLNGEYCKWGRTHANTTISPLALAYEPPTFCFRVAWVG